KTPATGSCTAKKNSPSKAHNPADFKNLPRTNGQACPETTDRQFSSANGPSPPENAAAPPVALVLPLDKARRNRCPACLAARTGLSSSINGSPEGTDRPRVAD